MAEEFEAEVQIARQDGKVAIVFADDLDANVFWLEPEDALVVGQTILDKAQQAEDDPALPGENA